MAADPLLRRPAALSGVVDYRGHPVYRSNSGGWTSALFIIGVEISERFAYYGISSNLITYLTGPLRESTAYAATAVNAWSGAASMLPLVGAFVADSLLGRFRTIVLASLLYILGLGMLALFAMLPTLQPPRCSDMMEPTTCLPSHFQVVVFFFSLYLVAFAQGGHKPCVQAFGADQFDENGPEERISKSSFFNWWYFGMCMGTGVTHLILNYVQDNMGWGLGFGIPCIAMGIALLIFLLGTRTYRYYFLDNNSFARIEEIWIKKHTATCRAEQVESLLAYDQPELSHGSESVAPVKENGCVDSVYQVEEAKAILRLIPIWATCLIYAVVFAQSSTFFTKQGSTLDRRLGPRLQVPPAALQTFIGLSMADFILIYDRILVPVARKYSKMSSGITMLQRIGTGLQENWLKTTAIDDRHFCRLFIVV